MTSSEISQIKKLESVKYHDIGSKNDLGTDLHVPLMLTISDVTNICRQY